MVPAPSVVASSVLVSAVLLTMQLGLVNSVLAFVGAAVTALDVGKFRFVPLVWESVVLALVVAMPVRFSLVVVVRAILPSLWLEIAGLLACAGI